MRHRHFKVFLILALSALCAMSGIFGVAAQQALNDKNSQTKSSLASAYPVNQADQSEPVAVTERPRREIPGDSKEITPEDFGNFRFPVINNKGEIAFLALYKNPAAQNNASVAIFVRQADGSWKITREGEKASNLPEGIHGFAVPSFNDNGDLTFYSTFGSAADANATPAADPNDPIAHSVARNGALFVKTAQGLKSLVKLGDEVPNMPSHFSGFANPSTNSKGVTAFIGTYTDPDGRGLFMVEGGKLRLVIRSGQKVGSNIEGTYSEHYYPAPINERGEVAFMQRIGEKSGIFVARQNGVEPIAFVGTPSPISGANYLGFGNRAPSINDKGEVAFAAFFDGPNAGRGLFFKGEGPTKVIAKSGDSAGNAGGNFTDFLSPAVNSRGDIAFIGKMGGRQQAMFIKTAKGIEAIAVVDQKIPGGKGEFEVFNNFTQPSVNDRGEVVFYAQLKNAEVAIFHRDEKGVLHTLVRRGDKMPK